jgi:hypothetical protein
MALGRNLGSTSFNQWRLKGTSGVPPYWECIAWGENLCFEIADLPQNSRITNVDFDIQGVAGGAIECWVGALSKAQANPMTSGDPTYNSMNSTQNYATKAAGATRTVVTFFCDQHNVLNKGGDTGDLKWLYIVIKPLDDATGAKLYNIHLHFDQVSCLDFEH